MSMPRSLVRGFVPLVIITLAMAQNLDAVDNLMIPRAWLVLARGDVAGREATGTYNAVLFDNTTPYGPLVQEIEVETNAGPPLG